jgi:hypothetical protein
MLFDVVDATVSPSSASAMAPRVFDGRPLVGEDALHPLGLPR